ncbi:hypothetical protein [Methanolapillus millepedarum]|uniref:Uncharacterized protein n=1 Tax=Methanolapillus millepedarum TaxID=3028296 RepID=A0AA96ZTX7_9EURY|nr:hypothetical protein MsAc7_05260 [Methanosarcinaceae archaeon Ac7]
MKAIKILLVTICLLFILTAFSAANSDEQNFKDPILLRESGKPPTAEEAKIYWPLLVNVTDEISEKHLLDPYLHYLSNGYGPSTNGYFLIGACMDCEIPEEDLDEMVNIVTEVGQRNGLEDIPIRIIREPRAQNASMPAPEKNEMPGFVAPTAILSLAAIGIICNKSKKK